MPDNIKQPSKGFLKSSWKEKLIFFLKLGLIFVLAVQLFIVAVSFGYIHKLPRIEDLENLESSMASEIYSSDSVLLGKYYFENRSPVSYEEISPNVIKALVATEDVRFYKHEGVDLRGAGRVFIKSLLLSQEEAGGGSTISQQLAKNLFPRRRGKFNLMLAKIKEWSTAARIEDAYSKEQILTIYLNTVAFGDNTYGIKTAARTFFNTSPDSLTLEEAATLIGMLKGTTLYNPRRNPKNALERRNVVISQMEKYDYITPEVAAAAKQKPIQLRFQQITHNEGLAPYFREQLRKELLKWSEAQKETAGYHNIYTDGLKIYTTINSKMQTYAEEAVSEHMFLLQNEFYDHWKGSRPWGNDKGVIEMAKKRSDRYKVMVEDGYTEQEINAAFNKKVKMKIFTWGGEKEVEISPLDSIKHYLYFLQAGFMAMEPGTGYIRAWVGGINHKYFKYDHVNVNTKRQVGSTFKPIVYAVALDRGMEPCEYISNEPITFEDYDYWTPENADGSSGEMLSLVEGLTHSVNTITAYLMKEVGTGPVINLARKMGIVSKLPKVPSIGLGTADISVFEMTGAFSTFVNKGYVSQPLFITHITDNTGKLLEEFKPKQSKALREGTAYTILRILQNVVNAGTGAPLRHRFGLQTDIAGKTGTTQEHADGWFIGMSPQIVAGTWVGSDDRRIHFRNLSLGQGSHMALPIFGRFMQKVYKDPSLGISKNAVFGSPSGVYDVDLNCEPYINPLDTLYQDTLGFDFDNEAEVDTFSRWDKIKERILERENETRPAEPKPEAPKPVIVDPKPEPKKEKEKEKEEKKKEEAPPAATPAPAEPPKEPETPQ